jgi:peptidoglycan/xylan/chitin deacetylase (PgdA/CDA1 family)
VAHGIMFHHFHDAAHPRGQGAMSADDLDRMIGFLGRDRILPAREWQRRAEAGTLGPGDLCLTFDDNLRCQLDVAVPVLRHHGLTAFWFVYTSVLQGRVERLEVYRLFRTLHFASTEAFYDAFTAEVLAGPEGERVRRALAGFSPADHLRDFPFYTDADRTFRFVRDDVLGPSRYDDVMDRLMSAVDVAAMARGLWMDGPALRQLHAEGHVVGLHSHTHPTRLGELPAEGQRAEYAANQAVLTDLLGERPTTMSHPCNSYSPETEAVLASLGVRVGFRSNMARTPGGPLEHPREDHANLLARMAA